MSKIILDFGSGNTCQNDTAYIKRMYDELKAVDAGKHTIIVKWQLFEKAGENKPLLPECFEYAYDYGTKLGYMVTASVFDKNSLDFLLNFDIPFVKIANNRKLDWLIGEVPRRLPVVVSFGSHKELDQNSLTNITKSNKYILSNTIRLACISKYPAKLKDYTDTFIWGSDCGEGFIEGDGISDHTIDFKLWNLFRPEIVEWHYKLSDSTGLDAGPFARTPMQLAEVL